MHTAFAVIALLLLVFYLLILARVVLDITRSFARGWRPGGVAAVGVEMVYASTDVPVKSLRRLIPPLRIGPVSIDVSVWLLLVTVLLLRSVAQHLAYT